MFRRISGCALCALIAALITTPSFGQLDGLYEFDGGGDGTSWGDANNWAIVLNPDGTAAGGGDPATPPDAVTSADIPLFGAVVNSAGQTALDVNVGTANGAGLLSITSGGLTISRDLFVGRDSIGTNLGVVVISGGTLHADDDITIGDESLGAFFLAGGDVSLGDDFFVNGDSILVATGGTLFVGDRLITTGNANVVVDGAQITADDDFFFNDNSEITVNSGSMIVFDKMRFDDGDTINGKLTINGGFVRANEFGVENEADLPESFQGVVEINGDGFLQIETGSGDGVPGMGDPITQLSVADAQALIDEGVHFITSDPGPKFLAAFPVIVPEFDGRTNVRFTQISLVPEPTALLLLSIGGVGLAIGRRRK